MGERKVNIFRITLPSLILREGQNPRNDKYYGQQFRSSLETQIRETSMTVAILLIVSVVLITALDRR